jgi:hypothetical protein
VMGKASLRELGEREAADEKSRRQHGSQFGYGKLRPTKICGDVNRKSMRLMRQTHTPHRRGGNDKKRRFRA